jgi:uncharacterized OB-fold protein
MTATRLIAENLFVEGPPPRLLGSRCRETGEAFYPVQIMNPVTRKTGTMEDCEFAGRGRLQNFTVINRGMPGFESPFALGVIELDEGPVLTAQLTDWNPESLAFGRRVELVIGTIKHDADGTEVIGPKFRPVVERSQ